MKTTTPITPSKVEDASTHQVAPAEAKVVLLVSPAPVDGYPPVQYQALLLAEAGYHVRVLTSYLDTDQKDNFCADGVEILRLPLASDYWLRRLGAKVWFGMRLAQWRCSREIIAEITYDPEGLFFSELCPWKPPCRIAHLHEVLLDPQKRFYEGHAVKSLTNVQFVVVADAERGNLLEQQVELIQSPLVVPNYPLMRDCVSENETDHVSFSPEEVSGSFKVVYHGSLGRTQALDTVIHSVRLWPEKTSLHLFGQQSTPSAIELQNLAIDAGVADRVHFEGWRALSHLESILPKFDLGLSILRPRNANWRFSLGASNKRYQYMQAGIAQISDNLDGVQKLIEGEGVGRCVDPECPESIAHAVGYYVHHPEECLAAGRRALMLHQQSFYYQKAFRPVLSALSAAQELDQSCTC